MKNIVIIGASDFQLPLILKAKQRGYTTHVFAWQCNDVGEKEADYFYPISIVDIDKIDEYCKIIQPDAICSIASDLAMLTVNELARRYHLPCNDEQCVLNTTNKYAMRQVFKEANLPTPQFMIVSDPNQDIFFDFPLIVKPTDRSGSRGITKVMDASQLKEAIKEAIDYSFEKKAIVEEYIDGHEYSFEAFAFEGEYTYLTMTKKFTTGAPHFIETGHLEPTDIDPSLTKEIIHHMFTAFKALNIQNGAIHAEFKLSSKGIRIIEIGARMGGDCIGSHLVEISTGYDYVGYVLDIALGIKPELIPIHPPKIALIQFIFNPSDIDTLNQLKQSIPEHIVKIYIDEHPSEQIVDSASRHGYYILALDSLDQIKGVLSYED